MNSARKIAVTVSSGLLVLFIVGSFMTRGVMEHLPFLHGQTGGWSGTVVPTGIVDQRPWQTAETLAELAESAEEQESAQEAERLADHEVDQAFAQSLRQANLDVRQLTGASLQLQQRVTELQQTVKEDQARIAALTSKTGPTAGTGVADGSSQNDLDVAKAQLGLDQNELADSMEDLARESGDQRIKIQQELSAREAEMKKYDAQASADNGKTAVVSAAAVHDPGGTDLGVVGAAEPEAAARPSRTAGKGRCCRADGGPCRLEAEAKQPAAIAAAHRVRPREPSSSKVDDLQRMAEQRKILSISRDRLGAQQQLAALYIRWGKQVELQHKIVVHLMLQSLALIAAIFLLTMLAGWLLQLTLERMSRDRQAESRHCEPF